MWLSALFGMVTKYAEVVLAVRYRERNEKGDWVGGPMYYIKNGLGEKGSGWQRYLPCWRRWAAPVASSETNPVKQSLYGIFEVFADTIVFAP